MDCGECDNCCACESDIDEDSEDVVPHVRGPHLPRFHTAGRKARKENPSKRYIAVELEVCGARDNGPEIARAVAEWGGAIVGDGSLPDGGFEINTAPASGDLFLEQVRSICAELERGGAWVDEDAGMHVHVDARDMRYYDMRRLVKLYAHVEKQLYRTCSPHRRDSRYCAPCGELYSNSLAAALTPKASKQRLLRNVYGEKPTAAFRQTKREKYHETRYHALNLHSWVYRGTVESRMYNGTIDPSSATSWGMLWAGLLDYASGHTERDIDAFVAENEPRAALLACAPTDKVRRWLQSRWNLLSRDHDAFDETMKARTAVRAAAVMRQMEYERHYHQTNMQSVARMLHVARPPAWAFDYELLDNGSYRWLGPDDIHADVFGDDLVGQAVRSVLEREE